MATELVPANTIEVVQNSSVEARAQTVTPDTAGGFLTPKDSVNPLLWHSLLTVPSVLQVARLLPTVSGERIVVPLSDIAGDEGNKLDEGATEPDYQITFGRALFTSYRFTSGKVIFSHELLQDAPYLIDHLQTLCRENIIKIINRSLTVGEGTSGPHGVVPASVLGATSSSAGDFSRADVINLYKSINSAYIPSSTWMCNSTFLANLIAKDTTANSIVSFMGDQTYILGRPVHLNGHMVNTNAAGDKVLLFGNFSYYGVRLVGRDVTFGIDTESQGDEGMTGFYGYWRVDGRPGWTGWNNNNVPVKHLLIASS